MINKQYDNIKISDVKGDMAVRRDVSYINNKILTELGMYNETTRIDSNSISYIDSSKIHPVLSDKTILVNLGTFKTNVVCTKFAEVDEVHKFNVDVLVSCSIITNVFNNKQTDLFMYNKSTNTIVINKSLYDNGEVEVINKYLDIIIEYNKKNNINRNMLGSILTMGTDPEFLLVESDTNRIVAVNNIVKQSDNYDVMIEEVGCDGRHSTGEFRPRPSENPYAIARNMKTLYKKLNTLVENSGRKNLTVVAGGGSELCESLGGHIHFSIPPSTSLVQMLDDFIGRPLKNIKGGQRSSSSYGVLGDHRVQPHGFEYRTPPSFIGDPKVFAHTMAAARCVALTWIDLYNDKIKDFKYKKTPGLKDYLNLSGADKYKVSLTKFHEFIIAPESNLYVANALAAWKIKAKTDVPVVAPKKINVTITNSDDINVRDLTSRVIDNIDTTIGTRPVNVYIYGIGGNRGIDNILMTHRNPLTYTPGIAHVPSSEMRALYGFTPACMNDYDVLFGIPYDFREDEDGITETVVTVCREIRLYCNNN